MNTTGISKEVLVFWRQLGAKEIDWSLLITKKLCPYLNRVGDITDEQLRDVIEELADSFEEIRNRRDAMEALENCRLLPCTDNIRRQPGQVYFDSNLVGEILGSSAKYVKLGILGKSREIRALLASLGVEDTPRVHDICERIRQLVAVPPTEESVAHIHKIYKYLDDVFAGLEIADRNQIHLLRSLAWLPEIKDHSKWYKPTELFTKANAKLFESQGRFIAFSESLKKELRDSLGVKDEPPVDLVIGHLLHCRDQKKSVNIDIYKFLQRAMTSTGVHVVADLRDENCIYIDGSFRKPSELFWKSHRFGRWRWTLDEKFKPYGPLLNELGARDEPVPSDYRDVLLSIASEFGAKNVKLDDQAQEVLMYCHVELASRFTRGQKPFDLGTLRSSKTIPNDRDGLLFRPEELLFKDKPRYLQLIGGQIDQWLITKEERTAAFFSMLGVRSLSKSVEREPEISGGEEPYEELTAWLHELSPLIKQVLLQGGHSADLELSSTLFEDLEVIAVGAIREALYLPMRHGKRLTVSAPLPITAILDDDEGKLYVVKDTYSPTDLAHEIANFLNPEVDSCTYVPHIERLLDTDSFEEATEVLHRWGYDVFTRKCGTRLGAEGAMATGLGSEEDPGAGGEHDGPVPIIKAEESQAATSLRVMPDRTSDSGRRAPKADHDDDDADEENEDEEDDETVGNGRTSEDLHPGVEKYLKGRSSRPGGEHSPLPPPSPSGNPQRRAKRLAEEILEGRKNEPPVEMRYEFKTRKVWKETDSRVRSSLLAWYDGKCQICQDSFLSSGGRPFFESHNIVKEKKIGEWIDRAGNCICLCPNHAARFEFGWPSVNLNLFIEQLRTCDLSERRQSYVFDIFLAGILHSITFTHDHVQELQLLVSTDERLREVLEELPVI